jgi:hypothetical protein
LSGGLSDIMCRVSGLPDIKTLKADIKNTAREVRAIFDQLFR